MTQSSNTQSWADKRIFTTGEAAEICKVSQQTIIRCFDSGRLGGFRVPGSKFRRIPRAELIKFMKANEIPLGSLEMGKKRVLVVDDDAAIVDLFRDLLTRDDRYEVRTCATGYDAGMLTEAFKPHLLILDYLLPDINGNIVCQRLRERGENDSTKVLIISGVVNQQEIDGLLKSGAAGFLKKPFDVDVLLKKIDELLEVSS
jgi:excisionase family DNA binding protein